MSFINTILNAIFDAFFGLTGLLGGQWALWIFSALAGIVFLFIFKWTSDQKAIRRVKDRIAAGFLAVRLFKDDFKQVWKANASIFVNAFHYMANALRPVLFMILPVVLMLIQLNLWYGYEPLKPDLDYRVLTPMMQEAGMDMTNSILGGTSTILTARVADDIDLNSAEVELQVDDGLRVVTPAVRVPENSQISWRIQALSAGEHPVTLTINGESVSHKVYVGEPEKFRKISAVSANDAWNQLWHPAGKPIPDQVPVESITVVYPEASFNLLGFKMHWVIAFFILSMVFGFALKGVFGVEI